MRKHLLLYIGFWLPAIVSAYLLVPHNTTTMQVVQWFLGFFMLLGWTVNSGMAAYSYPRATFAFIMAYIGVNAALITALVNASLLPLVDASFGSASYIILDHAAGAFTFRPLYMLYGALREFSISHEELWVMGIAAAACVIGFICGMFARQLNPDPIRPTFIR